MCRLTTGGMHNQLKIKWNLRDPAITPADDVGYTRSH